VSDDPYVYPGTTVLQNKFDIRDPATLDMVERRLVAARLKKGPPRGQFDLAHTCAIHRHLFRDIHDWAGQVRTVELAKGGNHFQPVPYIGTGMADVHNRLVKVDFLKGLSAVDFARQAGTIIGDVNHAHPFREGNGRTQFEYLRQLARQAGHPIDPRRIEPKLWIEASRAAHAGDYGPMCEQIHGFTRGGEWDRCRGAGIGRASNWLGDLDSKSSGSPAAISMIC
jgi:cell filamentation protein